MEFGISYTWTTLNLELIMLAHHLINNLFPNPNSSWSICQSDMEYRASFWFLFCDFL